MSDKGRTVATFITSDDDEWHIQQDSNRNLWLTGNDIDWEFYLIERDIQQVTGYGLSDSDIILKPSEHKWLTLIAQEFIDQTYP